MAVLEVYEYPHPVLKKKAVKVEKVDDALRKLMDDMLETMYSAVGVGLAAPQIGQSVRVLVIDYEQEEDENGNRIKGNPRYFVNPEIIWHSDEKVCGEEGCLSVPGQRAEVERFEKSACVIWIMTAKSRKFWPMIFWQLSCSMRWIIWTGFCILTESAV